MIRKFTIKRLLVLIVAVVSVGWPAMAQENSLGEVGGGYTFRSYSQPAIQQPPERLSMNGWNATTDYNFASHFGAALDIDWTVNNSNGAYTQIGTAMAGPQIYPFGHHNVTFFGHTLFGAGRYHFRYQCACLGSNGNSNYFTQYAFSWEVGGGVDYTLKPQVGIRLLQIDYEQVSFGLEGFGRGSVPEQSSWKLSAAILLRF